MSNAFQVFLARSIDASNDVADIWYVVRNCVTKKYSILAASGDTHGSEVPNFRAVHKLLKSTCSFGGYNTYERVSETQLLKSIVARRADYVSVYHKFMFAARPFPRTRRAERVLRNRALRLLGTVPTTQPLVLFRGGEMTDRVYLKIKEILSELTYAIRTKDIVDTVYVLQMLIDAHGSNLTQNTVREINGTDIFGDVITITDCGHVCLSNETCAVRVNGHSEEWCTECFDEDAVYVENEDEYWGRESAFYHSRRDAWYSYDANEDDEDAEDAEDDEATADNCDGVMRYSANVLSELDRITDLVSSAYGDFTMGVELEMTSGAGGVRSAVRDVRNQLGHKYCIIKSDGSLPENGFEVVTLPAPLSEHIARVSGWEINNTYRAWSTDKCGVHVHIDANAFTKLTLGKFIIFINKADNASLITKIAGRHPSTNNGAAEYCRSEAQYTLNSPTTALKGKSADRARYRMVNLCNIKAESCERLGLNPGSFSGHYDTVELRIFKASMKKERLLAQIEFTHAAVMFVRAASYRDLNENAFIKWLGASQFLYPNLASWFGIRKVKENPRQVSTFPVTAEQ